MEVTFLRFFLLIFCSLFVVYDVPTCCFFARKIRELHSTLLLSELVTFSTRRRFERRTKHETRNTNPNERIENEKKTFGFCKTKTKKTSKFVFVRKIFILFFVSKRSKPRRRQTWWQRFHRSTEDAEPKGVICDQIRSSRIMSCHILLLLILVSFFTDF